MSGGSWDYLGFVEWHQLPGRYYELVKLLEYAKEWEVADELKPGLNRFISRLTAVVGAMNALNDLWSDDVAGVIKAYEWWCSNDIGEKEFNEVLKKFGALSKAESDIFHR